MSNSGLKEKICVRKLIKKEIKISMNISKVGIGRRRVIPQCVYLSEVEVRKLMKRFTNRNIPGNIPIVKKITKMSKEMNMDEDLLQIEDKLQSVDLVKRKEVQDEQQDDVIKKGQDEEQDDVIKKGQDEEQDDVVKKGDRMNMDMVD